MTLECYTGPGMVIQCSCARGLVHDVVDCGFVLASWRQQLLDGGILPIRMATSCASIRMAASCVSFSSVQNQRTQLRRRGDVARIVRALVLSPTLETYEENVQ